MLVVRVAGIDDYGRLHQNELARLPEVTRLETSFALRDVLSSAWFPRRLEGKVSFMELANDAALSAPRVRGAKSRARRLGRDV